MFLGCVPTPTYGAVEYMEKEILTDCFPIQQTDFNFFPCVAWQDIYVNLSVKNQFEVFETRTKNMRVNTRAFLEKEDLKV